MTDAPTPGDDIVRPEDQDIPSQTDPSTETTAVEVEASTESTPVEVETTPVEVEASTETTPVETPPAGDEPTGDEHACGGCAGKGCCHQEGADSDVKTDTETDADTSASAPSSADPPPRKKVPLENLDYRDRGGSGPTVVVRYGRMRQVGEFRYNAKKQQPRKGNKVVIRSERGVEIGTVLADISQNSEDDARETSLAKSQLKALIQKNGENYPFQRGGRVLRMASPQDISEQRHLAHSAREAGRHARKEMADRKLDMKLVTVEHLLGGDRIIFYFTAETRVDFRDLVRELASEYRTRIEMRQVGARDESRLVADYERCGQRCCCQQFLKDLRPVSMRMAKVQKATLDPSKISGRCGRLMCCLRYEDASYTDLKKNLPRRNTWVRSETYFGRVVDTRILTQLVRVMVADGSLVAIPVDELLERDLKAPTEEQLQGEVRKQQDSERQARQRQQREMEETRAAISRLNTDPSESTEASKTDEKGEGDRPRRRRRRRGKGGGGNAPQQGRGQGRQSKQKNSGQPRQDKSAQAGPSGDGKKPDGAPKKKRRRRRRRGGGGGENSPASNPPKTGGE